MSADEAVTKPSRKRTLDDENSDPCRFLRAYYAERGIPESPEDDAALLTDCVRRAEQARESFKRWRASDDNNSSLDGSDVVPVTEMTAREKYQRRLVNNRRSAAASRVYQEVLRREHTHALRNIAKERNDLKTDVARLNESLRQLHEENARLAAAEVASTEQQNCLVSGHDIEKSETTVADESSESIEQEHCLLDASVNIKPTDHYHMGSLEKNSPSATATVTAAAFLPLSPPTTGVDAVASVARALLPILGSQSQSQEDGDEGKGAFIRNSGQPLYSVGVISSQLSQGDSIFTFRCSGAPASVGLDDFADSFEFLGGSQGFPSQGMASQSMASQGTATAGC